MKFREIFRFEFLYQARRVRTWLYFAVLFIIEYLLNRTAGGGEVHIHSQYDIAQETILSSLLWIVMAPAVAGSAAARDVHTRMHPLVFTTPIRKAEYLGGRFLAAFLLNALILLAVPLGILAALLLPGKDHWIVAARPAVYLASYGVLALPTAFTFTAVQFSVAALKCRASVSYLGSVLFFIPVSIVAALVTYVLQMPTLGTLLDPTNRITLVLIPESLTPIERETVLAGLQSAILANRLLWIGVTLAILAFTYNRFRLDQREG